MYTKKFVLKEEINIIKYLDNIQYCGYYKETKDKIIISSIDQKTTFDILNTNCKCILNLFRENKINEFSVNIFMDDQYTKKIYEGLTSGNGKSIISKKTKREYDKVFGNTFNTLSYAEVLEKTKKGNKNFYKIKKLEILEALSNSNEACIAFICHFIYKLIENDEEIINSLSEMKKNNNYKMNKIIFKESTIKWIKSWKNSNGKSRNSNDESKNISQKINNCLFYLYELPKYVNSSKSNELKEKQSKFDLAYFRLHKRDKNKPHGHTRREFLEEISKTKENDISIEKSIESQNKNKVKRWNKILFSKDYLISEYSEENVSSAFQIHHIWPKSFFNELYNINNNHYKKNISLMDSCENLILLSPNEHMSIGHKDNNTKKINYDFLNKILEKQFQKIKLSKKYEEVKYDSKTFYKLLCIIKNCDPINGIDNFYENNINFFIEELIKKDL